LVKKDYYYIRVHSQQNIKIVNHCYATHGFLFCRRLCNHCLLGHCPPCQITNTKHSGGWTCLSLQLVRGNGKI